MRKRKSTVLWVMVFVAVAATFAGSAVWAASGICFFEKNKDLPSGQCVNLLGYDVRSSKGLFPRYLNGNSIFKWAIVPVNPTSNLNMIDIKIPAAIGSYGDLTGSMKVSIVKSPSPALYDWKNEDDDDLDDQCIPVNCSDLPFKGTGSGTTPGWYLYKAGIGAPNSTLGKFEFGYYVLRVIPPPSCSITKTSGGKIKVVFKNRMLFSDLDAFLVKAGSLFEGMDLSGPSPSSQATPPIQSGEACFLGNTGCKMDYTLNSDGSLARAVVVPVTVDPNNCGSAENQPCCGDGTPLRIEEASNYFDCEADTGGNPINCKQRKSESTNFCEELVGSCLYKTTAGKRTVYYTVPEPCTPQ